MDYMRNCTFVDLNLHLIFCMKPSFGRSIREMPTVPETYFTKSRCNSILGAISAIGSSHPQMLELRK